MSPIHWPPPPLARGFQVLSCLARAERRPAQKARRSGIEASSYFGQNWSTSAGTVEASTAPSAVSAFSVAAVHSSASGRWSHRITGRNAAWPTSGCTASTQAEGSNSRNIPAKRKRDSAIGLALSDTGAPSRRHDPRAKHPPKATGGRTHRRNPAASSPPVAHYFARPRRLALLVSPAPLP